MMHISMILKHACMYGACIYDAANFVTNGRTDEPIDKAIDIEGGGVGSGMGV